MKIIKSIYEILKEIYAVTNTQLFGSIPVWLGLILNDFVAYRVHSIAIDECLKQINVKTANNNIKKHLILKEEKFLSALDKKIIFHKQDQFKKDFTTYIALNKFIEICNILKKELKNFESNYYDNFVYNYRQYLKQLNTKMWHVAVVNNCGEIYVHKSSGKIPKYTSSQYNKILWVE